MDTNDTTTILKDRQPVCSVRSQRQPRLPALQRAMTVLVADLRQL